MRAFLAFAAAGFLAACLVATGPARAQAASPNTLTIDLPNDVATMDPQVQWDTDSYSVYRNIFDNLVTRDISGKIVPQVASGWHYANDTTLVFDIRSDIRFQDGSKLTPDDVVFSIQRIIAPGFKSPQLSQFDQISGAEITGPNQVTVHTKSPYPVLLAQLVKLSIVPKAMVQRVGDAAFNQAPVGSGPYRLTAWNHGVSSTLTAVDGYWRGKPPFARAVFRVVPDEATRVADLRAGSVDLVRQLTPDDAEALKAERGLQVLAAPTERIAYLFVNALWGPTKDVRVRQAVAMAIDRNSLVIALQQGYGKPVDIMGTPASFGYVSDIKGWPFDPVKARALIKQAGVEGATLTFITSPAYDRRLTEAVQQMLGDVGLKVNIVQLDQPSFLRDREGTPQEAGSLSQGRWSCACQDADGTIFPLFRSGSIWAKYSNPAFDAAVDAARSTLDPGRRLADYHTAFQILHDDVPGIGLFQDYAIYGARAGLRWTPTPNEAFFLMDMSWKG